MSEKEDQVVDSSLQVYIEAIQGKKAGNLVVLDVQQLTSIADTFIICSGTSNRQVVAIADHIQSSLREQGIKPISTEGKPEGHWVLLDYGHVVIHVFYEPIREFYNLEGLWADAERISFGPTIDTELEKVVHK
jgi:ribosome-associated protein